MYKLILLECEVRYPYIDCSCLRFIAGYVGSYMHGGVWEINLSFSCSCSLEQLPVVCVERDGDEKCGEGEGSEDVTSCDVGKCEEGRSEGVKVETLEGGEKEGEGVTEGTVGGRGKGRGKGGRQKRHRAMRGRGRGQTSVEEDTPSEKLCYE